MSALSDAAADLGIVLNETQVAQFATYATLLREWNTRVNLTAITDDDGIMVRHFLDSLRLAASWGRTPRNLADIGSGAGFPGIPLKILRPELQLTLIESVAKKTRFLWELRDALQLDDVAILTARAEEVGHDPAHRERYDLVVARAVADLRVLGEYCLPLCQLGGRVLAPKGASGADEARAAEVAIDILGGRIIDVEIVTLPGLDPRTLVVIRKEHRTPPEFPRAPGTPAKLPLG